MASVRLCLQRSCRRDGEGSAVPGPQVCRHRQTLLLQRDERFPVSEEDRGQRQSALPRQDEGSPTPAHRREGSTEVERLLPTVQSEVLPDDGPGLRLVVAAVLAWTTPCSQKFYQMTGQDFGWS